MLADEFVRSRQIVGQSAGLKLDQWPNSARTELPRSAWLISHREATTLLAKIPMLSLWPMVWNHQNIAQIFDAGTTESCPFTVQCDWKPTDTLAKSDSRS